MSQREAIRRRDIQLAAGIVVLVAMTLPTAHDEGARMRMPTRAKVSPTLSTTHNPNVCKDVNDQITLGVADA
jgi:hypothetical protein